MTVNNRPVQLECRDLCQHYGGKVVLDDIDLVVRAGEFVSLVGPSGCGKSTLLRLIIGQERPSCGSILLDGMPIERPNTDRGIIYQRYALFPHLTALDNVLIGKKLSLGWFGYRSRRRECMEQAHRLLEMVKLKDHMDKYPHQLSGGQCQRVAIAQALIMNHKILLMDEPFGALDPWVREDLQNFMIELWEKERMTVFFVTHDLEEAAYVGSRIVVLSQYYTDDRAQVTRRGARIVLDEPMPVVKSALWKESQEFGTLLGRIRRDGFDPNNIQHISHFQLNHPDSFITPPEEIPAPTDPTAV